MKRSNVYTRTGDQGMTSLVGGRRVHKTNPRLEAYGTLDELNSYIGLLICHIDDPDTRDTLYRAQCDLFSLGGQLATHPLDQHRPCTVTPEIVEEMERAIDRADEPTGGWKGFILPGGIPAAAIAHVCRTVTRRLERRMYAIDDGAPAPLLFQYVNRLSDYFFVLAKNINHSAGVEEKLWSNRQ